MYRSENLEPGYVQCTQVVCLTPRVRGGACWREGCKGPLSPCAMVKAYLRYEAANTFGVVASAAGNMLTDHAGKLLISPALEATHVWNPKTGALVRPRSGCPVGRVMSAHARRRRWASCGYTPA